MDTPTRQDRLEEALLEYLQAREEGRPLDQADLLRRYPEVSAEVERFLANGECLSRVLSPVRALAGGTPLPPTPGRVGDYEVLAKLGQGGMGVVYKARHVTVGRVVALKMSLEKGPLLAEDKARFLLDAVTVSRLDHPGIVPLYDAGEHEGRLFFTLKLVEGGTLSVERLRTRTPVPCDYFREAARVVAQVANAVHFAHQRGVIHRDLKPGNILLDAEGHPYVTDFGLARPIEGDAGLTATGAIVGTPRYMAPEQAEGSRLLTTAVDVYGAGAVLYELLTGRPPFLGDNLLDLLLQVRTEEPARPSRVDRRVPRDLETICLKCLRKAPADRYSSAAELANDLSDFLKGMPIKARPVGRVERLVKWSRRHPGLAAGLVCALLGLGAAGYFAWRSHDESRRREVSEAEATQRSLAEAELLQAEKRQNALDRALAAATGGDLDAAEEAIASAELHGASTGQSRMLRGQVALFRGRTQEALGHLALAVKLLPRSVAARGLLLVAYAYAGRWDEYVEGLDMLSRLQVKTPEDFLFRGYAEGQHDPKRGLRGIDDAISSRPSMVVARLLRADLQVWRAQDTGAEADAERAVKEAEWAKSMLPGNPTALWVCLNARVVAAGVYGQCGNPELAQAALKQAGSDAEELKAFTGPQAKVFLPDAAVSRWLYFREVGNEEVTRRETLHELRRASMETDHVYAAFCYALTLYRRGDRNSLGEAVRVLAKPNGGGHAECLRPLVLAELAEGKEQMAEARKACEAVARGRRGRNGGWGMEAQSVLRVLGDTAGAVAACEELEKHPEWLSELRRDQFLRCVLHGAGKLSDENLERAANGSRWDQCLAHHHIAMKALAQGEREKARHHFTQAAATRAFFWLAYDLSCVLLDRLERYPNWPPWIPPEKKGTVQPVPGPDR